MAKAASCLPFFLQAYERKLQTGWKKNPPQGGGPPSPGRISLFSVSEKPHTLKIIEGM